MQPVESTQNAGIVDITTLAWSEPLRLCVRFFWAFLCPLLAINELGQSSLGLPKLRIGAVVFQDGEHADGRVVEDVAVKSPDPGIIGVENHFDRGFRRDNHGVAERALNFSPIDLRYLDIVTMQMHRMRHPRVISEYNFDALIFFHIETISIRINGVVNRPVIFRHVPAQDTGQRSVHGLFEKWILGLQF